jgi:hypothetical protein
VEHNRFFVYFSKIVVDAIREFLSSRYGFCLPFGTCRLTALKIQCIPAAVPVSFFHGQEHQSVRFVETCFISNSNTRASRSNMI